MDHENAAMSLREHQNDTKLHFNLKQPDVEFLRIHSLCSFIFYTILLQSKECRGTKRSRKYDR